MRRILLATTLLAPLAAHGQMIGSYTDGGSSLSKLTSALGGQQLPLQGVYVDSSMQFSQFVQSAQYEAGSITATCPPASCSPLLGLPMAGAGQDADAAFKAIASGSQDKMILGVLQAFADKGYQNIILRPGFEMNGGWFSWSVTEANAADFKAAFQRIAMLAHNFQDALVSVDFNPNSGASIPLQDYYPGNSYVDSIGIDLYGEPWQSDSAPNDPNGSPTNLTFGYLAQFAKDNGKPFSIPETGAATDDATFALQLAQAIEAAKVPIWFAGLWDNNAVGSAQWTDNPAATAAWVALANLIKQSKSPGEYLSQGQTGSDPDQPTVTAPIAEPGIDQVAALAAAASLPATDNVTVPDIASIASIAQAGVPLQDGPEGQYTPPTPPAGASTHLSITDDFGVLVDSAGAHSIAVSGSGDIVVANGGPETIDVTGHGCAIHTGQFNDVITLHTSGNTVDGGGGEDTVILDLPAAGSPLATPVTLATAGLSKAGNTIIAPPPGQGVLTIKGKLGPDDRINVAKTLAGTLWDGTAATMSNYLTAQQTKAGYTLSLNGQVVVLLTDTPPGGIGQFLTAGADL